LENSSTSEKEDGYITSSTVGERWAWGHQQLLEVFPSWKENWIEIMECLAPHEGAARDKRP
jgi:hypothetical protein